MMTMEEIDGKIIIHVIDVSDDLEPISWDVEVYKDDFVECIKIYEEIGAENPRKSAMYDFGITGTCAGGRY